MSKGIREEEFVRLEPIQTLDLRPSRIPALALTSKRPLVGKLSAMDHTGDMIAYFPGAVGKVVSEGDNDA